MHSPRSETRRVLAPLAAVLCGLSMSAQTVEEIPFRPPLPPTTAQTTEEVIYRHNNYDDRGFNRVVQNVTVPTLHVYRPNRPAPGGTALVVCPGGGYQYIAIDREGHALGRFFSARGITVAVLKYRLPDSAATKDGLPYPQQDALAAVQYVRERAEEWGINPRRVGILGCSAGGHLAGSVGILGQAANGTRPDFVALLYPVVLMDGPHVHQGSRTKLLGVGASAERRAEFSLERQARSALPPFFLVHAKDDTGVPPQNSERMAAALQKAGVPAELMLVDKGGHGFALGRGPGTPSDPWKDAFLGWLEKLPR